MAKADRLLTIITLLKGRRTVITARQLAEVVETSERTIYRDIQVLLDTGFPIEGEAGVGYRLQPGFEIPPIMFTAEQLLAVQLGLKMVKGWTDRDLALAAEDARLKIEAILPERLKQTDPEKNVIVPAYYINSPASDISLVIRKAIKSNMGLTLEYTRADGEFSNRVVQPLGLVFWGQKWTLIAFCLLRDEYREFRLDRIQHINVNNQPAVIRTDISLDDYIQKIKEKHARKACDKTIESPKAM